MSRIAGKYLATLVVHSDGEFPHIAVDSKGRLIPTPANGVATILASAARTTAQSEAMETPGNSRGMVIFVKVTVDPAAASITPKIEYADPIAGNVIAWAAAAAIAAVGTYAYLVYPGIGAAELGDITENVDTPLPSDWNFVMAVADADSMTYSVSVMYLP